MVRIRFRVAAGVVVWQDAGIWMWNSFSVRDLWAPVCGDGEPEPARKELD